jgi:hypothetical protein
VPAPAESAVTAADLQRSFDAEKARNLAKKKAQENLAEVRRVCAEWVKSPARLEQAWDGAVPVVRDFIVSRLKNPDSVSWDLWGKLTKNCDGYSIFVRFRAENTFGGNVVTARVFDIDKSGQVVTVAE